VLAQGIPLQVIRSCGHAGTVLWTNGKGPALPIGPFPPSSGIRGNGSIRRWRRKNAKNEARVPRLTSTAARFGTRQPVAFGDRASFADPGTGGSIWRRRRSPATRRADARNFHRPSWRLSGQIACNVAPNTASEASNRRRNIQLHSDDTRALLRVSLGPRSTNGLSSGCRCWSQPRPSFDAAAFCVVTRLPTNTVGIARGRS
jgi:hypothetical protein